MIGWFVAGVAAAVAAATGFALGRKRGTQELRADTEKLRGELGSRLNELYSLQELSYVLSESLQLDRIAEQVTKYLTRFVDCDGAMIALTKDGGPPIRVAAAEGVLENLTGKQIEEAESAIRSEITAPCGLLRITAAFPLGRLLIGPLLPEFLERYPEIEIDLALTDRHVDLVSEGFDLAIRAQQAPDSSLVARPLFSNPMHLVASPQYLGRHPKILEPSDLAEHNCIIYSQLRTQSTWRFSDGERETAVHVSGNFRCDSGDVILDAAVAGIGVTVLPYWMIHAHLVTGSLQMVLPDDQPEPLPVHAIYPQRRYLPLRVRCFIDFLTEKFAANQMIR